MSINHEAIRAQANGLIDQHRPDANPHQRCIECFQRWPCDSAGYADDFIALLDENEQLRKITETARDYIAARTARHRTTILNYLRSKETQ